MVSFNSIQIRMNRQFWFARALKRALKMRSFLSLILSFLQRKPSTKEWFKTAAVWTIRPFSVSIHRQWWYFLHGVADGVQICHLFRYSLEMYWLSFLKVPNPDDAACSSGLEISCFSDWTVQWTRYLVGQNLGDSGVIFGIHAYLRWLFAFDFCKSTIFYSWWQKYPCHCLS